MRKLKLKEVLTTDFHRRCRTPLCATTRSKFVLLWNADWAIPRRTSEADHTWSQRWANTQA